MANAYLICILVFILNTLQKYRKANTLVTQLENEKIGTMTPKPNNYYDIFGQKYHCLCAQHTLCLKLEVLDAASPPRKFQFFMTLRGHTRYMRSTNLKFQRDYLSILLVRSDCQPRSYILKLLHFSPQLFFMCPNKAAKTPDTALAASLRDI